MELTAGGTFQPTATIAPPGHKALTDEALAVDQTVAGLLGVISDVAIHPTKPTEDCHPPGSRLLRRTWDTARRQIEIFVQRYERGDYHKKTLTWLLTLWPTVEWLTEAGIWWG